MNIVFCSDKFYMDYTLVSCISVIEHNNINDLNIYILTDDDETNERVDRVNSYYKKEIIKLVYVENPFDLRLTVCTRATSTTLYRLIIPQVLDIDKAIYLDGDLICLKSLQELWDTNVKCCGMVKNRDDYNYTTSKHKYTRDGRLRLHKNYKTYYNSGVILMNCDYWRKNNISNKVIELLNNFPDIGLDQDALNEVLQDDILELPLTYNFHVKYYYESAHFEKFGNPFKDFNEAYYDPHILHWCSRHKPWDDLVWNAPWMMYYSKYIIDINALGILDDVVCNLLYEKTKYYTAYKNNDDIYIVPNDTRYCDIISKFYNDVHILYEETKRCLLIVYKSTLPLKDITIPDGYIYYTSTYSKFLCYGLNIKFLEDNKFEFKQL